MNKWSTDYTSIQKIIKMQNWPRNALKKRRQYLDKLTAWYGKGLLTQSWHFGRSRSIERSPKIFLNSDGDVARCVEIQTVCECRWIAIQYDCNLMNCYTISTEPHWSRPKMRSNHSAYFCSLIHGKDVFWIAVIPIDRRTVALHFMENVKTMIIYE